MSGTYCVIFRQGGPQRFRWRRALGPISAQEACAQRDRVVLQGYRALVVNYHDSLTIGLPTTFDETGRVEDVLTLDDGWKAMRSASSDVPQL